MKFWQSVTFSEVEQLIDVARIAEGTGFEGILVSEHLFYPEKIDSKYPYSPDGRPPFGPETAWPEVWTAIAAMAAVTERLRFATYVFILPLRDPIEVAKAISTVAVLSNNRVALGAGAGWMKEEFQILGRDFHNRGQRFDEMIEILRKIWAGGMVEHHGKFYDFPRLQVSPAPTEPVPIYVGGTSDAAFRRAAQLGDGWMSSGNNPAELPGVVERLQTLRKEAGRDRLPFETIAALRVPADIDLVRKLEDQGVTAIVNWPFTYTVGPTSTVDEKRRVLEQYGEEIIARCK
ncbi:MAG: LLM class F420-dependent oxidoreductase [Myxococcota bacterium]